MELLSLQQNKRTPLLKCEEITSIDQYKDFLACSHGSQTVSVVNLQKPEKEAEKIFLTIEQSLINHVKFFHNQSDNLRLMIAGNDKLVQIFDPESAQSCVQSIAVKEFVNHFSIDEKRQLLLCGYDAKEVELYDMKSGTMIG